MRVFLKGIFMLAFSSCIALADNIVLDFGAIERIELNLAPNQTLIIDHRRGILLGIMEISPNGKVRQLPIPKELLGKSEADVLNGKKQQYDESTDNFGGNKTTIYKKSSPKMQNSESKTTENAKNIKGRAKTASGNEKSIEPKGINKKRESFHQWDKSKIIYEQQEEVLDILR